MKARLILASLAFGAFCLNASAEFPTPTLWSPPQGVSTFNTITITWDFASLEIGPSANRMVTVTTPDGKTYTAEGYGEYTDPNDKGGTLDGADPNGMPNTLTVSYYKLLFAEYGFDDYQDFNVKGVYTFEIPAGAVIIDGEPNPAQTVTYDLGHISQMSPGTSEFVDDEDGSFLYMTWEHQPLKPTRATTGNNFGGYLTRVADDYNVEIFASNFSFNDDNTVLAVKLSGLVNIAGDYTFEFPGGQVQNNSNEMNPNQVFSFTVSDAGVEIVAADGVYKVYDLNGVKVAEGAKEVVDALAPGIYIVNGRKVLVK